MQLAASRGIEFIYAISPGLDIQYSAPGEIEALKNKLEQVASIGVHSFAFLFDDIAAHMKQEDAGVFPSLAAAQVHVTNKLVEILQPTRALFCPTEYCSLRSVPSLKESAYLLEVGATLNPDVQVMWTGIKIISDSITVSHMKEVCEVLRRKPVIWDNFHANDYDQRRAYLGPYAQRDPGIVNYIGGVLINPNTEFNLNFVAIHTLAAWVREGTSYNPDKALQDALDEWLPLFRQESDQQIFSMAELTLLVDVFYLPYSHGPQAQHFIRSFEFLLQNPRQDPEWPRVVAEIRAFCKRVITMFEKLTEIENRELLYDLYKYAWGVKEIAIVYELATGWLEQTDDPTIGFVSTDHIVGTYDGGFLADLQLMLPFNRQSGLFSLNYKANHKKRVFTIRPYTPADLASVYSVCLKTGDSGADGLCVCCCFTNIFSCTLSLSL